MLDSSVNNKRIAKNTLYLYLRMAFSVIVSLYTSRVVLDTLGVTDYGIYSVVGGIVVMFKFINTSMSGATSRFLSYEMGRNNYPMLQKTFSSALIVHAIIALLILVLAETIGLWILVSKLDIPEDRMFAAHIVYQCSVLTMMLSVSQVPYNASIIAHEKFDVYAYVEILHVSLKLALVFILVIGNYDKLILYAVLVLLVSVIIRGVYWAYCRHRFMECHYEHVRDASYVKKLLSFSGWDMYGNMSVACRQQGGNILVNMFLGVTMNAASGVATSVHTHVFGFCNNVITASRPAIIKLYAQSNIVGMISAMANAAKVSMFLFLLIALPLYVEMDYVLGLWLVDVPAKSAAICRILLISQLFMLQNAILVIAIHATGRIKRISIQTGTLYLLNLIPVYVFLYLRYSIEYAYGTMILFSMLIYLSNIMIVKHQIPQFNTVNYLSNTILKTLLVTVPVGIVLCFVSVKLDSGLFRLAIQFCLTLFSISLLFYAFVLKPSERSQVRRIIKQKTHLKM